MSFSAWLGLSVACFMLLFTRTRIDRIATLVSMAPFLIIWFIDKTTYHLWSLRNLFFSTSELVTAPLGSLAMAGYLLLFVLCVTLYAWTRNRAVSLIPWVVSIALTLWPMARDTVQTALWNWTNNPIFWGHNYPNSLLSGYAALTIIVRLLVLGLYMYACKKMDSIRLRNSNPA